MTSEHSVAIVGAGMAGLSCAVTLAVERLDIKVFEQNTVAGGRIASIERDGFQFDTGAQYFTAEDDRFVLRVADSLQDWSVNEWNAWLVHLDNGQALSHRDTVKRYVGLPSMNAMLHSMTQLCDIQYNTCITKLSREGQRWRLFAEKTDLGLFDTVIIALPPAQAAKLIQIDHEMLRQINAIYLSPCWSVMLGFAQSQNLGFDAAFVVNSKISWMARNNSKPDREDRESWVLHASCEWSEKNAKLSSKKVIQELSDAMAESAGVQINKPVMGEAYFWPEAKAVNIAATPYLYNSVLQLGVCGDWCVAPRVEGAFLSGLAMANAVLSQNEQG